MRETLIRLPFGCLDVLCMKYILNQLLPWQSTTCAVAVRLTVNKGQMPVTDMIGNRGESEATLRPVLAEAERRHAQQLVAVLLAEFLNRSRGLRCGDRDGRERLFQLELPHCAAIVSG